MNIGATVSEIFGGICRFCRIVQKGTICYLVISAVTGPNLIKFARNLAGLLPFNTF